MHPTGMHSCSLSYYHLPTKLWESVVFTGACYSVHRVMMSFPVSPYVPSMGGVVPGEGKYDPEGYNIPYPPGTDI